MIKFFRKIRQQLLSENKFSAYLIYALGEIVLVVIGILIALNINNWNTEQSNKAKREELLIAMTKDLAQDIASNDRMIVFYKNRLAFFERHLQKTDFSTTSIDTLLKIFDGNAGAFTSTDQSYQKAKNLGIAQLCSDDSLAMRIDEYYARTSEVTKMLFTYDFNMTEKQNDFWMGNQEGIEFHFHTALKIPIMQDSLERQANAVALISSPLGRNNIKTECMVKEMMLNYNTGIRKVAQGILSDIEAHLNKIE
ncbi:MAG: hypothetical protein K9G41_05590 [Flavobacteriales bacterium]|nr:hypothetical protein [Flavobacteriales bacterium]